MGTILLLPVRVVVWSLLLFLFLTGLGLIVIFVVGVLSALALVSFGPDDVYNALMNALNALYHFINGRL